jgi:hypothetical protein
LPYFVASSETTGSPCKPVKPNGNCRGNASAIVSSW